MFRRLMPRSVLAQITIVILVSVVFVVVVGGAVETVRKSEYFGLGDFVSETNLVTSLVREAPAGEREGLVAWAGAVGIDVELVPASQVPVLQARAVPEGPFERLIGYLFPPDNGFPEGSHLLSVDGEKLLVVPVDADTSLVAHGAPTGLITNDVVGPLSYYLLAFITLLVLFWAYSARTFLTPLARISAAVNRSSGIEDGEFSVERGSLEVLSKALNDMRERVRALLETRTRMLRSVSHDLRTPLTRLQQRVERVQDDELRRTMLSDIEQIDAMVEETLNYLRSDATAETKERVDVASLLQTIQADFADVGSDLTYEGPDHLVAEVKPNALLRAVTNLCENGLKFAGRATLSLSHVDGAVRIEVADDGPGISPDLRELVLEPFFKSNPARGAGEGEHRKPGMGLGLSIVSEIVAAHGGELTLMDNHPTGLRVRLDLPMV